MNEKIFCENCRKFVDFQQGFEKRETSLKGKTYCYMAKIAVCPYCKDELYVPEINDSNLKTLYDSYRRENGIISCEKIREIPLKYNIGKRPLSLLLGWGEQTFSRYCDGDMPTKPYSDILSRIYEEPEFFAELLEKNRPVLPSEHAYEKSKRTVDAMIFSAEGEDDMKIYQVANYLILLCGDITPLMLQKALYYMQGFYYAFYGAFLFPEDCEAWVHGPVYPAIYAKYKNYRYEPITEISDAPIPNLSNQEKELSDAVIKYVCCYSGKVLELFTHSETPWITARGCLSEGASSNAIISKDDIARYFLSVKDDFHMEIPEDIHVYIEQLRKELLF